MTRIALLAALALAAVGAVGSRADAKGCHETSHVVGHEHCSRFGNWSREQPGPKVWVDLGYERHAFRSEPFSLGTGPLVSSPTSADLGTVATGPIEQRVLVGIGDVLYVGGEINMGWLSTTPRGGGSLPATTGMAMGTHAIFGAHVALWRLSVGAELGAGGRVVALEAECGKKTCPAAYSVAQDRLELEARATADAWITPHISLGVALGRSVIDADDTRLMIYLGVHARALDGMR